MGGKSGGGARTPYEAPNTLSSAQVLNIIDIVSEGEIAGFPDNAHPLKYVYFNDTPVQNGDGSFNFKGVTLYAQRGVPDQSYVPGFDASERTVAVSARVKNAAPVVRTVSDALVSRLRVTVGVERNAQVLDNGDTVAARTSLTVTLAGKSGSVSQTVLFNEKGSGLYYQDAEFAKLPAAPFTVRVSRDTADSASDKVANNTYFASYVEIVDAKLSYPNTAFAALSADSDQFGSSVPRRNYLMKGLLLRVPSNYDPEARTYAGIWDGSFKTAWSNNPAWVLYDLLTRPRYSTLARRLKEAQIDKWALYEAGKYCDELVPDGFGGQEPRYVCNAYLTDMKQAGELLETLCSVFCGLPLWDGARFSVVLDTPADPVALYTNANVLDGAFSYGGAPLKSITTAVQVQYADKHDSYRAKTEYVADEAAVARYGLNIKQITAFGCDSRGQAVRFAQWTLQTALRQQSTVSFTVGREGLRHLPHDIVQVMDNDYAGAVLSGRLKSVSGKTLTLDAEVGDVAGAQLRWFSGGTVKSAKIVSRPKPDTVVLGTAPDIAAGGVWAVAGKVSPRLFRCVGIKENTDEGTYTITALLHDPGKYAAVDGAADFSRETHSLHAAIPALSNPVLQAGGGEVRLTWDAVDALSYDIKIYKDGTLYRHIPDADTPEIRLHNLANGRYRAEIRAKNARGALSEPLVKAWTLDYTITAVRTAAKTLAVDVAWTWPQTVAADIACEIWYGKTADLAKAAKLATLPYPQNGYTLTGVGAADEYWFWLRIVDNAGNTGEFTTAVRGASDPDPAPVVRLIHGQITESALSDGLKSLIDGKAAAAALDAEAKARAAALDAEAQARTAAVQAAAKKAADDLAAKARELGTKITSVETVNSTQATQIQTVTAAHGRTAAALEAEKTARADGIRAETQKREAAVSKLDGQVAGVVKSVQTLTEKDKTRAQETSALTTRMGQAEGSITQLKQSSITREQAETIVQNTVSARFQIPDTRNDNQPPTWYWTNYPKQTVTEFKTARALGLTGSVYAALETRVAFVNASGGAIFQTATLSDGKVWRRKSDTAHTYANGVYTYTKDQWTAWVQDETVDGAQAKADAVKKIAEAAQKAAQIAAADITEFKKTYATEAKAEAQKRTTLETKLGQASAKVEQTAAALTTLEGKVRAVYGIKAETIAGGRKVFAGLTLGADGQTGESEVLVWADKFAVVEPATKKISPVFTVAGGKVAVSGDVIADGTVQGRHIAAGVKLITPEIVGAGGLFRLDKNGTVTMQSSPNKVGLKINGDAIEVYDENGVLRVKMGRLA
jgi:ORF 4